GIQVIAESTTLANSDVEQGQVDVVIWSPGMALDQDALSTELANSPVGMSSGLLIIHADPKIILPLARQKLRAWGSLSPEASKEELIAAIEAVNEGLVVTSPSGIEFLSRGQIVKFDENMDIVNSLTGREIEVLELMAQGLTNKQIALKLGISAHTVKFHVSSIYGKMDTTNRTETVKLGLKKGLILL
ncbi:MAG TPA: response regulator transcription factor, partial [Anaerolineales bacterium]